MLKKNNHMPHYDIVITPRVTSCKVIVCHGYRSNFSPKYAVSQANVSDLCLAYGRESIRSYQHCTY